MADSDRIIRGQVSYANTTAGRIALMHDLAAEVRDEAWLQKRFIRQLERATQDEAVQIVRNLAASHGRQEAAHLAWLDIREQIGGHALATLA